MSRGRPEFANVLVNCEFDPSALVNPEITAYLEACDKRKREFASQLLMQALYQNKPPAKAPRETLGGFYEETDHFSPSGIGQEEEETLP